MPSAAIRLNASFLPDEYSDEWFVVYDQNCLLFLFFFHAVEGPGKHGSSRIAKIFGCPVYSKGGLNQW